MCFMNYKTMEVLIPNIKWLFFFFFFLQWSTLGNYLCLVLGM